jgi:hypothetical protein
MQKPVDFDAYFKYNCANKKCSNQIWISTVEAKTKEFKIVCDLCNCVFRPARIKDIQIQYYTHNAKKIRPLEICTENNTNKIKETNKESDPKPEDFKFIRDAIDTMVSFGYTQKEAEKSVKDYHRDTGEESSVTIVKTLMCLGDFDNV